MAERHKSKDGVKETEDYVGEAGTPGQAGRADGELARKVGTRAEENNAPLGSDAAVERVRKSDKRED